MRKKVVVDLVKNVRSCEKNRKMAKKVVAGLVRDVRSCGEK